MNPDSSSTLTPVSATPFEQLPWQMALKAFGVDYGHVRTAEGGDLYLTWYGWPFLRQLLPENWHADNWYARAGEKLQGSTGNVYRVKTRPSAGSPIEIVVKFSRVGQEVPLEVGSSFPDHISPEGLADARFNSPLEEFGLVMELRRGNVGPRDVRLLAQKPLAIYAPPERFELWQLGRSKSCFSAHQRLLTEDQENQPTAIGLDIRREYVLLYSWIKGEDAQQAAEAGDISQQELGSLTRQVIDELHVKGFRVLDNKPRHFILRRRRGKGEVLRRHGRLAYGLVDFELLQRTREYQQQYRFSQRLRYWSLLNVPPSEQPPLPPHIKRVEILGVGYIYGTAPNGGRVWTVGTNPDLFDYFLPDRWRRTPRVKLSLSNEVYHTRTRDTIHVVYRRSRVGERPFVDPFYDQGKRIREFGYNSPFEEAAIAEWLRKHGIPVIHPRAIYRTGHESVRAGYLRDDRRYITHANLLTPDDPPEPVLSPSYDYYSIWGYHRGLDPAKVYRRQEHWGFIDVEKAREDNFLSQEECRHVLARTRARLSAAGFTDPSIGDSQFLILFNEDGSLKRDSQGELDVTWCLDAMSALEYNLLDDANYHALIRRFETRLQDVGCEALNLSGHHLLLSMDPDCVLRQDEHGEPAVSLCNFELLKVMFCPV
ncbi:MAG: hypothetical protein AMXMBFR13_04070 [Phycisphaerae bacterium]